MNALEISQLKKVYKGQVEALKGINLTVAEGDFFALLGPNGAGKSTTIGILTALVNKTSGQVKIFGHDLDAELELAKSYIGIVPQEFNFNQFETVQQIVVNQAGYYGVERKIALERSEIYLKQTDLWEKRNTPARNLSGGMKRRLMIARAMMHQPKLLILDEPTAGVDIEIRRSMWKFLQEINKSGVTIILTTHYLEEAENLCRNIAIIDQGLIIENTSMKTLLGKLSVETFILDLAQDVDSLNLNSAKGQLLDAHTLQVEINKGESLNRLFAELTSLGIDVVSMRNKSNRLEELFVNIVEQGKKQEIA